MKCDRREHGFVAHTHYSPTPYITRLKLSNLLPREMNNVYSARNNNNNNNNQNTNSIKTINKTFHGFGAFKHSEMT